MQSYFLLLSKDSTPLHHACANGHLRVVEHLCPLRGVDPTGPVDRDGRTASHLAALNGHADVVRYISGYSVTNDADNAGHLPITLAIENGHE